MSDQRFSFDLLDQNSKAILQESLRQTREKNHSEFSIWSVLITLWAAEFPFHPLNSKDGGKLNQDTMSRIAHKLIEMGFDENAWSDDLIQKMELLVESSIDSSSQSADQILGTVLSNAQKVTNSSQGAITPNHLWIQILSHPELIDHFKNFGLTQEKRVQLLEGLGVKPESIESDSALDNYCVDLTKQALGGKLGPIIGRDDETRETMNILQRLTKNNPILVGEPGVGKTAMVEGLAIRMSKNEVPENLKNKRLLSLDVGSIMAGTKYRGDIEERVKGLIKEIQQSSDVVLFIDEIHTLVNSNGEASSVGQLLKPALARGELRCIGATSVDEYRQYLEKDPALERRFERVNVYEPKVEEAVAILRGVKDKYTLHHGVEILDSALVSAVELSSRYMTDRQLPEKAIDLIDAAAASVRTILDSKPIDIDKIDRKIVKLEVQKEAILREKKFKGDLDEDTLSRLDKLKVDIKDLKEESTLIESKWREEKVLHEQMAQIQQQIAQNRQDFEKAKDEQDIAKMGELQYGALPQLEESLRKAKRTITSLPNPMMQVQVGADQVADAVSIRTGIPVAKMNSDEAQRYSNMEQELNKKVIGQDEAVDAVSRAVRRSRSGLADPKKPIGSFLFLGPTGVGKTELTKVLGDFLFERKDSIIRMDMSEFMEKHAVNRLIGAPPGYVGYEEGGVLTEGVRQNPYSIVLFDEVEKAHPDIFNVLLQVLDDGHLTDGRGRTVDFKNTVIIMTSNLGAQSIQELSAANQSQEVIKDSVMESVRDYFRPEFINRLNDIVMFKPLDLPSIGKIASIKINTLQNRLQKARKINLEISDEALTQIAKLGFDPLMGARPLARAVEQYLEDPLSSKILSGTINQGDTVSLVFKNGELKWDVSSPSSKVSIEANELNEVSEVNISIPEKIKQRNKNKSSSRQPAQVKAG